MYRISVFVDLVVEGGGPRGYSYNLREGLKNINTGDYNVFFVSGSKSNALVHRIINKIYKIFMVIFSDVCVFQGCQRIYLAKFSRFLNKTVVYMPHSPSIFADEYKMQCDISNSVFDKKLYSKFYFYEKNLLRMANYLVFPVKESMDLYNAEWNDIISNKNKIFLKSGTIIRKQTDELFEFFKDERIVISFIGRYVSHKGYDLFCEAAKKLSNDNIIRFISVGAGGMKDLAKNSNVEDYGYVKGIGKVISLSDVIIISNRIAYYDLLPIECASYGKPLIFSEIGGNLSQCKDFIDSLSFENEDVDDLCDKIEMAIKRIQINPTWGENNKNIYNERFTCEKFAKRWLEAFEYILTRKPLTEFYIE